MKLTLPSGITAVVEDPEVDFPRLVDEAEERERLAREDAKLLKKIGKQAGGWPVAVEGGAA